MVSPDDCAACHPIEREQFGKNKMSQAYGNLMNNPVYHNLQDTINGIQNFDGAKTTFNHANEMNTADSYLHCHGNKVEVKGMKSSRPIWDRWSFPYLTDGQVREGDG